MTIANMPSVLVEVRGGAVGAFNVVTIEHAEAIAAGAESARLPAIMQLSENTIKHHGALRPIGRACLSIAETSSADIVVHLDHATGIEMIEEAVDLGFRSVMYDGSHLDDESNVAQTVAVVRACRSVGVWVEAELGEIGGKGGAHRPRVRTDPAAAKSFVVATDVNALAVAVGSSHAMTTRTSVLDTDLIALLARTVDVPLVLHGSSGVPDDGLVAAVGAGISKVNIGTHLNMSMTETIRRVLADDPGIVDPRQYLGPARTVVEGEVMRFLTLLAHRPKR